MLKKKKKRLLEEDNIMPEKIDHFAMIRRLREMRLPVMADELDNLMNSNHLGKMNTLETLKHLIDEEYTSRKNNTVRRFIKKARFSDSRARLSELIPNPEREINISVIEQLKTNQYISNHRNVILLGATGSGKSFIANALGVHACESGFTVKYTRMIELLSDLEISKIQGNYRQFLKQLGKFDVLIIDDFLLSATTQHEQQDLMEVIEKRSRDRSTIFCSQMEIEEWHRRLGSSAIADSILDRIIPKSHKLILKGESLRSIIE